MSAPLTRREALGGLAGDAYQVRTPAELRLGIVVFLLAVAGGLGAWLHHAWGWHGAPSLVQGVLLAFAALALALLFSPTLWRPWISLAADRSQLVFVDGRGGWLRIPWSQVERLTVEPRVITGTRAVDRVVLYVREGPSEGRELPIQLVPARQALERLEALRAG